MDIYKKIFFGFFCFICFVIAPKASAWSDLSVKTLTVKPAEPALNQPVVITVAILYRGDQDLADNSAINSYTLDFRDFELTKTTIPAVSPASPWAPDKTKQYLLEGSFRSLGEKTVTFTVNSGRPLAESDWTNNYLTAKITVAKPFDLKIESISTIPKKPAAGQELIITVKAKNNGYESLSTGAGSGSVLYDFSGFTIKSRQLPLIDSNQRVLSGGTFTYEYRGEFAAPGDYHLSFAIDAAGQLEEKDESNNRLEQTITVLPLTGANLTMETIAVTKSKPLKNETLTITAKVKNTGALSLNSGRGLRTQDDFSLQPAEERGARWDFGDFVIEKQEQDPYPSVANPLEPGEFFQYKFTGYFPGVGQKTLSFTVNNGNQIAETDAADNQKIFALTVYENAAERDDFQILSHAVEYVSSRTASVLWQTNAKAAGKLEYKRSEFTSFGEELNSAASEKQKQTLNGLKIGASYDYKITAVYSGLSRSAEGSFQLPFSDELCFLGAPVARASGTDLILEFATGLAAKAAVFYRPTGTGAYKSSVAKDYQIRHSLACPLAGASSLEYYLAATSTPGTIARTEIYHWAAVDDPAPSASVGSGNGEPAPESGAGNVAAAPTGNGNGAPFAIKNGEYYRRLLGKIILKVESAGEAYYINPSKQEMCFLGRPADAFAVMRGQGIGITDINLEKIPVGWKFLSGADSDGDGLPDMLEDALGADRERADSDGDGYSDLAEITNGYNPRGPGRMKIDGSFAAEQAGKIFLQVESKGEAWYINPADNKRYFLGRPADAFAVMRYLGLGISNSDFGKL